MGTYSIYFLACMYNLVSVSDAIDLEIMMATKLGVFRAPIGCAKIKCHQSIDLYWIIYGEEVERQHLVPPTCLEGSKRKFLAPQKLFDLQYLYKQVATSAQCNLT